jgi:hypothetical protein
MAKPRRSTSLYANVKLTPLTPNLLNQDHIIVKITPDTKIERALYRLLLDEKCKTEKLRKRVAVLEAEKREHIARSRVSKLSRHLKPHS